MADRDVRDHLDRAWDEIVRGDEPPADEIDPETLAALRWADELAAATARATARRPEWDQVLAQAGRASTAPARDRGAGPGPAPPAPRDRPATVLPATRRRWWTRVEAAVAAVLLLGLVTTLLALYQSTDRDTPPEPALAAVWHFRGDAGHTGAQLGPAPAGEVGLLWSRAGGAAPPNSPAVAGGLVYAADRAGLVALDAASGAERWQFEPSGAVTTPAVAGGLVFVGVADGTLYALEAATGAERWRVALGKSFGLAVPTVADGTLYAGQGTLAASPAVVGGLVYAGGLMTDTGGGLGRDGGVLVALDAASGAERWRFTADGAAFYALDAATGNERWRFEPGDRLYSPATVAAGTVYLGAPDGYLYALDAATGARRWRFMTGDAIVGAPAVVGGVVYVGSLDGSVYALDALDGAQRWRFPTRAQLTTWPAVTDGLVFVAAGRHLFAIDAATGGERWRVSLPEGLVTDPVVVDGVVYAGGENGTLYALAALSAGATPLPPAPEAQG